MSGEFRDECGVFAFYNFSQPASPNIYKGIKALQHRGDQNAGIITMHRGQFQEYKGPGRVDQVFSDLDDSGLEILLPGMMGIGHDRWSTQPGGRAQPVWFRGNQVALAHNGNIHDTDTMRDFLHRQFVGTEGMNDSEMTQQVINNYLERGASIDETMLTVSDMMKTRGAAAIVGMTKEGVFAWRNAPGIRPLVIGESRDGIVFASETCALDAVEAKYLRDVRPGELAIVDHHGLRSIQLDTSPELQDAFEPTYFANPASVIMGRKVSDYREYMGMQLALNDSIDADLVIGVPASGNPAGLGYSRISGIEFTDKALLKVLDVRSFIQDEQEHRDMIAMGKYWVNKKMIKGRRIVAVDDSIVRGTTGPKVIKMLFDAGAREVHFRSCAPPIVAPDRYGNAFSTSEELISTRYSKEEIARLSGATTLEFNTMTGYKNSMGKNVGRFTYHVFGELDPYELLERRATTRELVTV